MKRRSVLIFLAASLPAQVAVAATDPLCVPLRKFVESVQPNETRTLDFHTSWGGNFKDSSEPVIYAKRCNHYDYDAAKPVCAFFIKQGAVEFAGDNFERAVACLSPETRFGPGIGIASTVMSFNYGTHDRGSNVTLEYGEDSQIGGMVLKITTSGY